MSTVNLDPYFELREELTLFGETDVIILRCEFKKRGCLLNDLIEVYNVFELAPSQQKGKLSRLFEI